MKVKEYLQNILFWLICTLVLLAIGLLCIQRDIHCSNKILTEKIETLQNDIDIHRVMW